MEFQNAIITNEGVRIFQRAGANDNVVFTSVLFCGADTTLSKETEVLPSPTWGNGVVNNYAARADAGGDFVLYMSLTNDTDHGYAYGYGVYGYLQSEGVENEKLLIVANHAGTVTYVSEASGSYTRFHLAITMRLHLSSNVISIAPHYNDLVSDVAFQQLADRVVTTHAPANESVGEDQSILGDKTFVNQTRFGGTQGAPVLMLDNDKNEFNERVPCGRIRAFDGNVYGAALEFTMGDPTRPKLYTNSDVLPMSASTHNNGTAKYPWYSTAAKYTNTERLTVEKLDTTGRYQLEVYDDTISFNDDQSEAYATISAHTGQLVISDERGGNVKITPGLYVDGHISATGVLSVSDNAYITGDLTVSGATTMNNPLKLNDVTLDGRGGRLLVNRSITVQGAINASNGINAAGITTNAMKYAAGIDTENYPIATLDNVPIGAIIEVWIPDYKFPYNEEVRIEPGEKLTGYTLETFVTQGNRLIYGDNSFPLPDTDGSHYRTLSPITHRYVQGEDNGVAVWVIKVE